MFALDGKQSKTYLYIKKKKDKKQGVCAKFFWVFFS